MSPRRVSFHDPFADIATDAEGFAVQSQGSVECVTLKRASVGTTLGFTIMSSGADGAVLVTTVEPGGIAAGKLSVGDRIVAVNDEPGRGANNTIQLLTAHDSVVLTVERSAGCACMAAALNARQVGPRLCH